MYDAARRKMGPLDRAEQTLFGLFYLVQRNVVTSTLFYVAAVVQGLAVASAAFGPQFEWSRRVTENTGLRAVMRVLSLESVMSGDLVLESLLAACMLLVVVTAGLTAFASLCVAQGSVPPQRVSRLLQKLIGVQVALQGPITSVLVSGVTGGSSTNGTDLDSGTGGGVGAAALFGASVLSLTVHIVAVLLFSRMHSYLSQARTDPTARALTGVDAIYSLAQISIAIMFRVDRKHPVTLAVYYFAANAGLTALVASTMPFYRLSMTCLRVAIHAACAWLGACLVAVAAVENDDNDIASTVFVTGIVPVAMLAYRQTTARGKALSEAGRARGMMLLARERGAGSALEDGPAAVGDADPGNGLLRRAHGAGSQPAEPASAAAALVPAAGDMPALAEPVPLDGLVEHVDQLSDESALETTGQQLQAAAADAGARYLLDDANGPADENELAGACLYYREALARSPRSEYLLMRYVEFLVVFRGNLTLANMIVTRASALGWDSSATRFDIHRYNKDMQRAREQAGGGGGGGKGGKGGSRRDMDVIAHEEVQKTLRRTRKDHALCNRAIDKTLKAVLSRNASPAEVTALMNRQFEKKEEALARYEFLLEQVPSNMQVNKRLAVFFDEVMLEPEAAQAVRDEVATMRAEAKARAGARAARRRTSSARDDGSGGGGGEESTVAPSSVAQSSVRWQNAVNRLSTIKVVKTMRDAALAHHARRMRLATLLLLCAIVAAVVIEAVLYPVYRATLFSVIDSGSRRSLVVLCATHARSMHLAAPSAAAGDAAASAEFEDAAAALEDAGAELLDIHSKLVYQYAFGDDGGLQSDFYFTPSVRYVVANQAGGGAEDVRETTVSGADAVQQFVQDAQAAAAGTPEQFAAFDGSAEAARAFPGLFAVLRNAPGLAADMDTSTFLYQNSNYRLSETLLVGLVSAGCVAALAEIVIVVFVIRPAVAEQFRLARTSVLPVLELTDATLERVVESRKDAERSHPGDGTRGAAGSPGSISPRSCNDESDFGSVGVPASPRAARARRHARCGTAVSCATDAGFAGVPNLFGDVPIASVGATPPEPSSPPLMSRHRAASSGRRRVSVAVSQPAAATRRADPARSVSFCDGDETDSSGSTVELPAANSARVSGSDGDSTDDDSDENLSQTGAMRAWSLFLAGQERPSSAATGSPRVSLRAPAVPGGREAPVAKKTETGAPGDKAAGDAEEAAGTAAEVAVAVAVAAGADDEKGAAAATAMERDMDGSSADKRRYLRVVGVYSTAFVVITGTLVALTAYASVSIGDTRSAGADLNNGGRLRGMLARSNLFSREVMLLADPGAASLGGGLLDAFATEDLVRCHAREASNALSTVHINLVRGGGAWKDAVPQLTGWPALEPGANCSALTPVPAFFEGSLNTRGVVGRSSAIDSMLFTNSCLSDPNGASLSGGSRVRRYSVELTPSACPLWLEGDARVQQGLHSLLLAAHQNFRDLAEMPVSALAPSNPAYDFILRYSFGPDSSQEMMLGVLRLLLKMHANTEDVLHSNEVVVILLVTIASLSALVQHAALSNLLGQVIRKNIGLKLEVERFVAYAHHCEAAAAAGEGDGNGDGDECSSVAPSAYGARRSW